MTLNNCRPSKACCRPSHTNIGSSQTQTLCWPPYLYRVREFDFLLRMLTFSCWNSFSRNSCLFPHQKVKPIITSTKCKIWRSLPIITDCLSPCIWGQIISDKFAEGWIWIECWKMQGCDAIKAFWIHLHKRHQWTWAKLGVDSGLNIWRSARAICNGSQCGVSIDKFWELVQLS